MVRVEQRMGDETIKRQSKWLVIVMAAAMLALVGLVLYAVVRPALFGQSDAQPAASEVKPARLSTDDIQLLVGGIPRPFKQGAVVPVVGDLEGQLTLRTADAAFLRNFDLFLYQETPNSPFEKADVQVEGHMPDMAHGDFRLL
ncbi:MAG TPA: hypothetical protein VGK87_15490, partial [Anaerolineae bacterium]